MWEETTVFSKVTRAGGTNMANFIDLVLMPSKSQHYLLGLNSRSCSQVTKSAHTISGSWIGLD